MARKHRAMSREEQQAASAAAYGRGAQPSGANGFRDARQTLRRPGRASSESGSEYSRSSGVERYHRGTRRRRRHGFLRVFVVALLVCVLGFGGAAFAYMSNISGRLNEGIDSNLLSSLSESSVSEPFYMLLIGVDKSQDRVDSDEFGAEDSNYRTDSIILSRIDPLNKKVTLVSIPRDILVDLGANGQQKINAAYSIGGAAYTVETVSKFAGVPISHYAEIDFDNFTSVVDTIGGITVNIPIDMDDDLADAHFKAGEQTLNGEQALALSRSRHAFDEYGVGGDFYRASNQRMVIGAILKKVLQSNPLTIANTVNTLAGSVTTDFSVTDILSLAMQFQGFDMDTDLYSGQAPTNSKYVNNTWYELCDTARWQEIMTRVDEGLSPYSSEDEDPTRELAGSGSAINNGEDATTGDATEDGADDTAAAE